MWLLRVTFSWNWKYWRHDQVTNIWNMLMLLFSSTLNPKLFVMRFENKYPLLEEILGYKLFCNVNYRLWASHLFNWIQTSIHICTRRLSCIHSLLGYTCICKDSMYKTVKWDDFDQPHTHINKYVYHVEKGIERNNIHLPPRTNPPTASLSQKQ